MPVPGGGFDQAYNAQAAVDTDSLLVVAPALTQATNDKQQMVPMLEQLQALPPELGRVKTLLADAGYASEDNVNACAQAKIRPLIALGRETHHRCRCANASPNRAPLTGKPTPLEAMRHRLQTRRGRKLYALRKSTVEPVFGLIKRVMKFRQFLLRGVTGCPWRMESGVSGLESEANECPFPEWRKDPFAKANSEPHQDLVRASTSTAEFNFKGRQMHRRYPVNSISSPTDS